MKRQILLVTAAVSFLFSPVIFSDMNTSPTVTEPTSQNDIMKQDPLTSNVNGSQNNQNLDNKLQQISDNYVGVMVKNGNGQAFHVTVPKEQAENLKVGDTLTVSNKMSNMLNNELDDDTNHQMGGQNDTSGTMNDDTENSNSLGGM
tara:strand:- start:1653 stop:2090 length:438 start_codon:yes stop_codon:yes gene_type:complete